MPQVYHIAFFTVRDGISDDEVIARYRRWFDLAISKGYIKSADDVSLGKVIIPTGLGDDEMSRLRQTMTGGFTWVGLGRFDSKEALDRFLTESPADMQATNILDLQPQPPRTIVTDHVNQFA